MILKKQQKEHSSSLPWKWWKWVEQHFVKGMLGVISQS